MKLCFQVLIVLSSADEAGTCRVYEGVCGDAALMVSRVRVSRRCLTTAYRVTRIRSLLSRSNRLVARVKWITARTASMSGLQSSLSGGDLPPSRRDRLSPLVHAPRVFRCSLHLAQRKTKCSLGSTASPHSHRFVSTALMLCGYPFSGVMPVRSWARMLACLLLRSSYKRRVWLPGQAASILLPNGRRHLLSRLPQTFLGPLNNTSGQPGSVSDHSSLSRGSLR